jgi:hypothetical protein
MGRHAGARIVSLCVAAAALLAAACAGPERPAPSAAAEALEEQVGEPRFDEERALALLARAQQREAAGDEVAALGLYEQAAELWPDLSEAWDGIVRLSQGEGAPERRAAASFMVERVALYPSDQLFVQRDVASALRLYVEREQALEEVNATQLAYAETLADFYEYRYAQRGTYEPPSDYVNLRGREVPAAILSLGIAAASLGALAGGGGGD